MDKKFKFRHLRHQVLGLVLYYLTYIFGLFFAFFWILKVTYPTFHLLALPGSFISMISMLIYAIGSFIFLCLIPKIADIFYPETKEEYLRAKKIAKLRFEKHKIINKIEKDIKKIRKSEDE